MVACTGLHDFRCYLRVALLSLTPLYNLPCASPLFWLMSIARYVFKSPSVCLRGTKYYVYCGRVAYLHSLLWHHAWQWLELFASTVGRFVSQISYLPSYIFLQRRHTFTCTSRKLIHLSREILMYFLQYACLEKFLCFSCTVWSSLCFWSSTYQIASHADVLRLVTCSFPRTSAQRTGNIRLLAVSQS